MKTSFLKETVEMIGDQCLIIKGKELAEVQMKMAVKRKEILR